MFKVKVRPTAHPGGVTFGLWHRNKRGLAPAAEVTRWPTGWVAWVNPRLVPSGVDAQTINGTSPHFIDRPVFPTAQAAAAAVLLTGVIYDEGALL